MLAELRIRDVGVIADVSLELAPGLNVLTGETGAGKTMVVSSLELLLGGRADAGRVRAGAAVALVEGRLVPPPAAAAPWLDDDDDELIVAREVAGADGTGRGRVRLGGRMAPVSALADVLGSTVELHGQSDSARLSSGPVQRELLDRSGGPALAAAAARYAEAYAAWRAASDELETLRRSAREREREADRLRFEIGEIDAVAPEPAEEEELAADLRRLEHAEALRQAASAAAAAITADGGARDGLGTAVASLRPVDGVDAELDELSERVSALAAEAQDVGLDLAAYASAVEADPVRLESLRDRWAALVRLTRKYGDASSPPGAVDAGAVAAYATTARGLLDELEGGDARATALDARVDDLHAEVLASAAALRAEREDAGKRLAEAVHGHLADLAMADARMEVVVEPVAPGPSGADRVSFLLAANRGEPALPLGKAASGGERSRVALALRLALADADRTPVLVFDEVDAGIGGATALAVGRKLARLARGRQVLCVTHLAQLAAHADAHFVVSKDVDDERTVAAVRRLAEEERAAELARMLSGTPDSERAAEHAAELRANAKADAATR